MTGAIALASTNIQAVFSTFSTIADQAMFITDLLDGMPPTPKQLPLPLRDVLVQHIHAG